MENINSNAQPLWVECRRGADWFSRVLCMFIPGLAAIIGVMLIRDFIEPAIAHSAWALCSVILIGLGILRSDHKNAPALLGTLIAVVAATYFFFQVAATHPDQWIFLGWAFAIFAIPTWMALIHFGVELSERAAVIYGWPWRIAGMIYMMTMFGIPLAFVVLLAS